MNMWLKLYLNQYKYLINKGLLVLFMLALYFFYFVLLFDLNGLMEKLDMFVSSSLATEDYLKYPLSMTTAAWVASFFVPLWMIFLLIFLSSDWSKIKSGSLSFKRKFFICKLSFAYTLPFDWTLTAIVGGLLLWGKWGSINMHPDWTTVIALWLQVLAYVSFAILLVSLFPSAMKSVLAFIGYFVIEAIVRKLFFSLGSPVAFYLPAKVITSLVIPPAADFVNGLKFQDYFSQHPIPFWINALLSVFYSAIFLLFSYYLNFKAKSK